MTPQHSMETPRILLPIHSNIYDEWNEEKKSIQSWIDIQKSFPAREQEKIVYINEREIWYAKLGVNLGSESHWKKLFLRPVLILKKVGSMFFVAPMTTKWKDNKFHYSLDCIQYNEGYTNVPDTSRIQLSQVKIIDKCRFSQHIGIISKNDFSQVKQKLRELIL